MLKNIHQHLKELASFSSSGGEGVTRILYSPEDIQARQYLKDLCQHHGLQVREDNIGNTFIRWVGTEPTLPAVGTGSHIDAIPQSGMYDGTVGVLGGLHAVFMLKEAGFQPRRSIEVLLFTAEEPTRFGIGCLGSRVLSGDLSRQQVLALKDSDGVSFAEWRKKAGYDGEIEACRLPPDYYSAFVELHIEQGPILEKVGQDIGIVTKIAAPSSLTIRLTGEGGHAGSVLMLDRKDAGCAAAEIVLAVEHIALNSASEDTVATCGIVRLEPSAVNSIPKSAYLEIDLRDTNPNTRDRALMEIQQAVAGICDKRSIPYELEVLNCDPPAICDQNIVGLISDQCKSLGFSHRNMISRAYHDALFMAQCFPTSMIFVPSRGGVSHRPDEYTEPEQIENGVRVLAASLQALSK